MRILIAAGPFGLESAPLSPSEATAAIATGWRRRRPRDVLIEVPMAGTGTGFLDVMRAAHGGRLHCVEVPNALGDRIEADFLVAEVAEVTTAFIACEPLCRPSPVAEPGAAAAEPRPVRSSARSQAWDVATTVGVGEVVIAALQAGARRVVVALGSTIARDGGAGMLAALGAAPVPEGALSGGLQALAALRELDVRPALAQVRGIDMTAVTDERQPLVGLRSSTAVEGTRLRIDRARLLAVDACLARLADAVDRRMAERPGAGAAGGLGFAVLAVGGRVETAGAGWVADQVGLGPATAGSDLMLTGQELLDWQALGEGPVAAAAAVANAAAVPCVALAARVDMGSRELRNGGLQAAYAAGSDGLTGLAALGERVAKTWGRDR